MMSVMVYGPTIQCGETMPADIIVGLQWGDEGKGKLVDALARDYNAVARYQGGPNAGHTVFAGGSKYVFHAVPSGVLHHGVMNVIGNGVVMDIKQLAGEIRDLQASGVQVTSENLSISLYAHVIMPYHVEEEKQSSVSRKIDTTKRGIGPAYTDKVRRTGLRVIDFYNYDHTKIVEAAVNHGCANPGEVYSSLSNDFEFIRPFVADTSALLNELLEEGDNVLCEGAQGTMLDVDHGTYPYVTSSTTTAGGALSGLGIGPKHVRDVIGVAKAYVTRVGEGPFPTEMDTETEERIRQKGREFGATTGRSRKCGWIDLPSLKYAARVNGVTRLAIMKLDVLDGEPLVKACVKYEGNNNLSLGHTNPVYREFGGWTESTQPARTFVELPHNARNYLQFAEENTGAPLVFLSTGPDRYQIITE